MVFDRKQWNSVKQLCLKKYPRFLESDYPKENKHEEHKIFKV